MESAQRLSEIDAYGAQMQEELLSFVEQVVASGEANQTVSLPTRIAFCTPTFKRDFQVKVALPAQCLLLLPYRGVGAPARSSHRVAGNCSQATAQPVTDPPRQCPANTSNQSAASPSEAACIYLVTFGDDCELVEWIRDKLEYVRGSA